MNDNPHMGGQKTSFRPKAMYFEESDCVEYIRKDVPCVHRRIDGFLTLILEMSSRDPLGFQLKGFKNFYLNQLRPVYPSTDFLHLVNVLQIGLTHIGDHVFSVEDRARGYERAIIIADEDKPELPRRAVAGNF